MKRGKLLVESNIIDLYKKKSVIVTYEFWMFYKQEQNTK
jgi:hypothetical protein